MEQDTLYQQYLQPVEKTYNSVGSQVGRLSDARPKFLRCPSDGESDLGTNYSNYAGSLGPQCAPGPCGVDPFLQYCNGQAFGWGYATSPEHGNSPFATDIRGMFNRIGAKIGIASVSDGTSNTFFVGEVIPAEHDHYWNASWMEFNGGASHVTTIVPLNYPIDPNSGGCSPDPLHAKGNWDVSWGFKSKHTSGANFLFVDGSVHFINQSIDTRTYNLLGCRNDGQVPGDW